MYDIRPSLIFGFHGCDAKVRDNLLKNPDSIKISKEPYDWLGHGMYFWENNIERAMQWAMEKEKRGRIEKAAVIGAVLNLGYCCDLVDSKFIQLLKAAHNTMYNAYAPTGEALPSNKDLPHDIHQDKVLRELDCAVIEFMHTKDVMNIEDELTQKGFSNIKPFDSTRNVFTEGGPIYTGAGILDKSHIQICIRNMNCIKGFFLPRREIDFMKYLKHHTPSTQSMNHYTLPPPGSNNYLFSS